MAPRQQAQQQQQHAVDDIGEQPQNGESSQNTTTDNQMDQQTNAYIGDKTGSTSIGADDSNVGPASAASATNSGSMAQSRPLRNLISYLEQKDAAGVISLVDGVDQASGETNNTKLLYAFPPGDFALNLIKRKASNLISDPTKEEFLLGVIVGGNEGKI